MTEFTPISLQEQHRFPCDNCGSDLRFDPKRDCLLCDHCGNMREIDDAGPWNGIAIQEMDFRRALASNLDDTETIETRVTQCTSCGAAVEFDPDIHATECPFCATPVVADTGSHRQIKPKGLLPFDIEEEMARDAVTDWLGRLWFAPNGLVDYARKGRKMSGIYVPYWTFDAETESRYRGERGTDYYETRTVTRDGKRQQIRVRKTRWRSTRGRVGRFFDDVLVLASTSLPKRFTDALEPWDLASLEPYQPEYLAGFRAEAYQIGLEDGFREGRAYMDKVILRDVKFDIGGDRQRVHSIDTDLGQVTFKHILLPVWLAAYKYRGKTYRFVVNGRTGRVQGERPYSAWKIALAIFAGLVVAAVVGYLYALHEQNGGVIVLPGVN